MRVLVQPISSVGLKILGKKNTFVIDLKKVEHEIQLPNCLFFFDAERNYR